MTEKATPASDMSQKTYAGMTRRTLCLGVGGIVVLLGLGCIRFVENEPIVRPPGGQDEDHLLSACIHCGICYESCPEHIITPAKIESGVLVARTPTLDFSDSFCTWCEEQNDGVPLCVQSCPTNALLLPDDATRENTILGKAVVNSDTCLAYRFIGCLLCYQECPYGAVTLDEFDRPIVNSDACNGCGACEACCISQQGGSTNDAEADRAIKIVAV